MRKKIIVVGGALVIASFSASGALAQTSSLLQRDIPTVSAAPLRLSDTSWSYQEAPPPPKKIQKYDILTIRVDEKSTVTSKGSLDRTRNGAFDAEVKSWFNLKGLTLRSTTPAVPPSANVTLDSQLKAEAGIKSSDGLAFNISVMVLEIRPNDTLVIEGHKILKVNDENWELSLTGTISADDIPSDRHALIMSEKIANLDLCKREAGDVREGYNRGWVTKFYDKVKPF